MALHLFLFKSNQYCIKIKKECQTRKNIDLKMFVSLDRTSSLKNIDLFIENDIEVPKVHPQLNNILQKQLD